MVQFTESRYGTQRLVDQIISRDHLVIKFLLSTGFEFFDENQATRDRLYSFFGEGIFAGNRARAKEVCQCRSTNILTYLIVSIFHIQHRAVARPYFGRLGIVLLDLSLKENLSIYSKRANK